MLRYRKKTQIKGRKINSKKRSNLKKRIMNGGSEFKPGFLFSFTKEYVKKRKDVKDDLTYSALSYSFFNGNDFSINKDILDSPQNKQYKVRNILFEKNFENKANNLEYYIFDRKCSDILPKNIDPDFKQLTSVKQKKLFKKIFEFQFDFLSELLKGDNYYCDNLKIKDNRAPHPLSLLFKGLLHENKDTDTNLNDIFYEIDKILRGKTTQKKIFDSIFQKLDGFKRSRKGVIHDIFNLFFYDFRDDSEYFKALKDEIKEYKVEDDKTIKQLIEQDIMNTGNIMEGNDRFSDDKYFEYNMNFNNEEEFKSKLNEGGEFQNFIDKQIKDNEEILFSKPTINIFFYANSKEKTLIEKLDKFVPFTIDEVLYLIFEKCPNNISFGIFKEDKNILDLLNDQTDNNELRDLMLQLLSYKLYDFFKLYQFNNQLINTNIDLIEKGKDIQDKLATYFDYDNKYLNTKDLNDQDKNTLCKNAENFKIYDDLVNFLAEINRKIKKEIFSILKPKTIPDLKQKVFINDFGYSIMHNIYYSEINNKINDIIKQNNQYLSNRIKKIFNPTDFDSGLKDVPYNIFMKNVVTGFQFTVDEVYNTYKFAIRIVDIFYYEYSKEIFKKLISEKIFSELMYISPDFNSLDDLSSPDSNEQEQEQKYRERLNQFNEDINVYKPENIDDKIYYLLLFYILSEKYNEITYKACIIFDEEDKTEAMEDDQLTLKDIINKLAERGNSDNQPYAFVDDDFIDWCQNIIDLSEEDFQNVENVENAEAAILSFINDPTQKFEQALPPPSLDSDSKFYLGPLPKPSSSDSSSDLGPLPKLPSSDSEFDLGPLPKPSSSDSSSDSSSKQSSSSEEKKASSDDSINTKESSSETLEGSNQSTSASNQSPSSQNSVNSDFINTEEISGTQEEQKNLGHLPPQNAKQLRPNIDLPPPTKLKKLSAPKIEPIPPQEVQPLKPRLQIHHHPKLLPLPTDPKLSSRTNAQLLQPINQPFLRTTAQPLSTESGVDCKDKLNKIYVLDEPDNVWNSDINEWQNDDLELNHGDIITDVEIDEMGWGNGKVTKNKYNNDYTIPKEGKFPINYTKKCEIDLNNMKPSEAKEEWNNTQKGWKECDLEISKDDTIFYVEDNDCWPDRYYGKVDGKDKMGYFPTKIIDESVEYASSEDLDSFSDTQDIDDLEAEDDLEAKDDQEDQYMVMDPYMVNEVITLFPYTNSKIDELSFERYKIITDVESIKEEEEWKQGKLDGNLGLFPENYTTPIINGVIGYVFAFENFDGSQPDEISFKKNDVIYVLNDFSKPEFYYGIKEDRTHGYFPKDKVSILFQINALPENINEILTDNKLLEKSSDQIDENEFKSLEAPTLPPTPPQTPTPTPTPATENSEYEVVNIVSELKNQHSNKRSVNDIRNDFNSPQHGPYGDTIDENSKKELCDELKEIGGLEATKLYNNQDCNSLNEPFMSTFQASNNQSNNVEIDEIKLMTINRIYKKLKNNRDDIILNEIMTESEYQKAISLTNPDKFELPSGKSPDEDYKSLIDETFEGLEGFIDQDIEEQIDDLKSNDSSSSDDSYFGGSRRSKKNRRSRKNKNNSLRKNKNNSLRKNKNNSQRKKSRKNRRTKRKN